MSEPSEQIYLYGPSGSGKTSLGHLLAAQLDRPYLDLDEQIESQAGRSIPEIFSQEGEVGFRIRERAALAESVAGRPGVIALGGGALLEVENRRLAENTGRVVCLTAGLETLVDRLSADANQRPLLAGSGSPAQVLRQRLKELLARREAHYASFPIQIDTTQRTLEQVAWELQIRLGDFRITGMGPSYDALVRPGGLDRLGALLQARGLSGPLTLVSDSNVAPLYASLALASLRAAGFAVYLIELPAGEQYKTISSVERLWSGFLEAGLDRSSAVLALGGGVTGDLAGFAAATYLRGVRWVGLPSSLLAMVDASLGGKTGADLPQGKNLVGAFHPPALVLADPALLHSLPVGELRSGLAEVVKHGVIGDPELFRLCEQGWQAVNANLAEIVRRAMAVKIRVIEQDPYEQGQRAALNLGHTLGHAIELASDFRLRHGEGVAIGMLAATRYAQRIGLAAPGLADRIEAALAGLGLPVALPPGLDRERILAGIGVDKKRKAGKVRLALPVEIGQVQVGIPLEDPHLLVNF
jgi:3-dehydroquinate synthase